ncbi:scamp family-domain-containing protein [Suillus subaureus]|uniref:Scamp family-domain-containing protein n=1 Tax=Suillus subaureus TaxID=48587 RepID=A0A9P7ENR7_9AGAM|nr:scamp family-domain-containing protein [Suillus subaureus]KAG1827212.1 scamp family-domain-containing protein [Suillus subaureus]
MVLARTNSMNRLRRTDLVKKRKECVYLTLHQRKISQVMSEFTENPFASSHSLDTNPFDDPSSKQAAEHDAHSEDISRRERDLERRERELNQRAEHIRTHGRNNWPPFYPLIYHAISEEIPEASRPLITRLYQLWLVLFGTLIINMVACIFLLIAGSSDGGKDLGGSIGYVFIIAPLSFLLWYRPIYNGYMKVSVIATSYKHVLKLTRRAGASTLLLSVELNFDPLDRAKLHLIFIDFYFFFGGFHLLFSVYMIIGIPSTGSAGLIQMIQMYAQGHWAAGILGTIATVGWTVQGLGNAFYYHQIWNHHSAAGHTMDKAKAELASHGAKAYFTRG